MDKQPIHALYVDHDPNMLLKFQTYFKKHYKIFTAFSEKEAREILARKQIHVIITDYNTVSAAGTTSLDDAIKEYPDQGRILLTTDENDKAANYACDKGLICKYVVKPYDYHDLKEAIDLAYEVYSLRQVKKALYKEWVKTQEALDLLKQKASLSNTHSII